MNDKNRPCRPFVVYPDTSSLSYGEERFRLIIEALGEDNLPSEMVISVMHLDTSLTEETIRLEQPVDSHTHEISLEGLPIPSGGMGLGIEVSSGGYTASTALDRGAGPIRYGFVSDFLTEDGKRCDTTVKFLLQNHITHVQYYDWAYRPHRFGPEDKSSGIYCDTMGKSIDLNVVKALIDRFHDHGILSLGYGAVYAATIDYLQEHPEQALYDIDSDTFDLIEKFFIMNLADEGWKQNILGQYRYAVDEVGFDGIHMDTYGYPKAGWGYEEKDSHSLEQDFCSFIDAWGKEGHENIFNNVGGWPAVSTAAHDQAACYIEVWEPHTRYHHLRKMISEVLPVGKPVILAAYLEPFKLRDEGRLTDETAPLQSALLLTAAVTAYGATSLLLGEDGVVLTQPYYSDYSRLTSDEIGMIRSYYDFQVRYRELFYDKDLVEITESHAVGENREISIISEYPVSIDGEAGTVWATVKRTQKRIVLNLINLIDQDDDQWNAGRQRCSTTPEVEIQIPRYTDTMRVFTASPDIDHGKARELITTRIAGHRGPSVSVRIPRLTRWMTLCCELK